MFQQLRRERIKLGLYLRLKKRKMFEICVEVFMKKIRKQFRDTERMPFMLDNARQSLFPNCKQNKIEKKIGVFLKKMSHVEKYSF